MPTNQIQPFALGGGAYVLSPTAYAALGARTSGFPPGLLPKEWLNTALRQANFVTATVAKFVFDYSGQDVLDDGDISGLEAKMLLAIQNGASGVLTKRYIAASGLLAPGLWLVDGSAGGVVLSLPAAPALGNSISMEDACAGTGQGWQENEVVLDPNGNTIEGLSESLVLDASGQEITLWWTGTTWHLDTTHAIN